MNNETLLSVAIFRGVEELKRVQNQLKNVEHQLEDLYEKSGPNLIPDEIRAMQDIDLIIQSTSALADYLEILAADAEGIEAISIDKAIYSVPLLDLAARLRGDKSAPANPNSGKTDIF